MPATPTLLAVSPSSAKIGAAALTVVITGTNFEAGAKVYLSGVNVAAGVVVVSPTKITFPIDPSTGQVEGYKYVEVENVGPPAIKSNRGTFTFGGNMALEGVPGNALTTLQEYLDDRKWLFFEKGLQVVWEELYILSQTSNDPQQAMLASVFGRYNFKVTGSPAKQPPTTSRLGSPGMTPSGGTADGHDAPAIHGRPSALGDVREGAADGVELSQPDHELRDGLGH